MYREIIISLSIADIAAIAQRAIVEKMAGIVGGQWAVLWQRVETKLDDNRERKPHKGKAA